jgi:hypothetical protein
MVWNTSQESEIHSPNVGKALETGWDQKILLYGEN